MFSGCNWTNQLQSNLRNKTVPGSLDRSFLSAVEMEPATGAFDAIEKTTRIGLHFDDKMRNAGDLCSILISEQIRRDYQQPGVLLGSLLLCPVLNREGPPATGNEFIYLLYFYKAWHPGFGTD